MKKLIFLSLLIPSVALADTLIDLLPGDGLGSSTATDMCVNPGPMQVGISCTQADNEHIYIKDEDDGLAVTDPQEKFMVFEDNDGAFIAFRASNNANMGTIWNAGTDGDWARQLFAYDGSNGVFIWYLNNSQRMRLQDDGDLALKGVAGQGIILTSPDSTCSKCSVNNSDVFSCTSIACP